MDRLMMWMKRYVTLCGILMICSFFMCLFFDPTRKLNLVTYFGQCLLLAFIALASLAVYYSKEELSQKAWWIRTILHLLLLEIILLPLAHHWQFWFDAEDAVVYAIFILIGKVFWHIVDYSKNVKTAADVNKKLKERTYHKNSTQCHIPFHPHH
jgi:hypothetical protein